jgi:dihydrofolate reductase
MAKLIYVSNVSLDGYIEDEHGSFDWTEPDDEVFAFITNLVRGVGTYLYGRRLYESMAVWESDPALAAQSALTADFANVWQAADKVVYSTTLRAVSTARTRLESSFDPDSIRDMKASATSDLTVGGANLAAQAFQAGLVDECHLFIYPVLVGGGKPSLPATRVPSSSCLTSAGSATASSTSATAARPEHPCQLHGRRRCITPFAVGVAGARSASERAGKVATATDQTTTGAPQRADHSRTRGPIDVRNRSKVPIAGAPPRTTAPNAGRRRGDDPPKNGISAIVNSGTVGGLLRRRWSTPNRAGPQRPAESTSPLHTGHYALELLGKAMPRERLAE